jgi:uncharacterized protein (TIGR03437 family)
MWRLCRTEKKQMSSGWLPRPFLKVFLVLIPLVAGARFLAAQTLSSYSASLTSSMNSLMQQYPAKSPVIIGANNYLADGAIVQGVSTQVLLDYVDGLKAAGAQRIDLNPAMDTVNNAASEAKYDAIVQHIRELGLQLAINPQFATNEAPLGSFQAFQTLATQTYAIMAARYQPDRFVIVHEPTTMAGRMGLQTTVADWTGFVDAMAPIIKAASPATLVGAGDYYGARPTGLGNSTEAAYYAAFVVDPNLDFTTMDVYTDDPASIAEFAQWAQMAHANNKIVYMEETGRPSFLPTTLPANWASQSDEALSVYGSGYSAFAPLDAQWLAAMTAFCSANGLEAMTYFQTNTLFLYVSSGVTQATNPAYLMELIAAVPLGQTTSALAATTTPTSTSTALLSQTQQWGIKEAVSLSNASYATIPSIYNPNCGSATDPCNANSTVAPDGLVSAFGADLATTTAVSTSFPTSLGGTSVTLVDSANITYNAQLYSVSAQQVNYLVPSKANNGKATVTVTSGDGVQTIGTVLIQTVAPGLYTANANGEGVAAAIVVTTHANGSQSFTDAFSCGGTAGCVPAPISLGSSTDTVAIELFGTGLRHLSSTAALSATINNQALPVLFAGAQSTDPGLDQINVQLPQSLAGSGLVNLLTTIATGPGTTVPLNTVTLDIQ